MLWFDEVWSRGNEGMVKTLLSGPFVKNIWGRGLFFIFATSHKILLRASTHHKLREASYPIACVCV